MNKSGKPIALFSLNDTTDAILFAEDLIFTGWEIIGSSETVKLLRDKQIPVTDIADFAGVKEDYGFPPTLHPRVEYALTGNNNPRIDLVYVLPYPLSHGNDVGGRTLLSLAVKGSRIPVMTIGDMREVVLSIKETGWVSDDQRLELADKVCFNVADHYASLISNRNKYDIISGQFSYELLNGENPYQIPAAVFANSQNDDVLSLTNFTKVSGESPCFTNMADADCILRTMTLAVEAFKQNQHSVPYICIAAKHGNPCGMGVSSSEPIQAVEKALWGNPLAVWGGEVITNFEVDDKIAVALYKSSRRKLELGDSYWMLDLVIAPEFSEKATDILGKRKMRKLFKNKYLTALSNEQTKFHYRQIRGGFLRQPPANFVLNLEKCKRNFPEFDDKLITDFIIAWSVVFSANHGGNEVALARNGALLSAGGGPSTVEAAKVAIMRANDRKHSLEHAVAAADAFFPFTDAPALLCEAGISGVVVPGGGKHETDIKSFFNKQRKKIVYIPEKFRGFCRH